MGAVEKDRGADTIVGRSSGFSIRRWLVRALVIVVVLSLVLVGAGAAFVYVKFSPIWSSEPYCKALEQVRKDPYVIEQLGEPIQDVTWLPSGEIEADRGTAILSFAIAGPKGHAQVSTQARCIGGVWGLVTLDVILPNGQRQPLDTGDGGDAPKWSPGS